MSRGLPYRFGLPPIASPTNTASVFRSSRAANSDAAENVFRPVITASVRPSAAARSRIRATTANACVCPP